MSPGSTRSIEFAQLLESAFERGRLVQLILSKPGSKQAADKKITVTPIELRGEPRYQFAIQGDRQETHENLCAGDAAKRIHEDFGPAFRHCHIWTADADIEARLTKRGQLTLSQRPPTRQLPASTEHNRQKSYLIPEGRPCGFLQAIEVMTADGKVRAKRQHKFRQINRFLELVNDTVGELPAAGPIRVVDFGCGKSYLTFAVHHLLTVIYRRRVSMTGIDINPAVIADCQRIAAELDCAGLEFRQGEISAMPTSDNVHLAVSLHACDTATDDALAFAVNSHADVILAAPCCQHEVAGKWQAGTLDPLAEHGILKERIAAMLTDALRAKKLECRGYKTQIVEFIDMEHTPKNLLIRAVRREQHAPDSTNAQSAYDQLKSLAGLKRIALDDMLP